MLATSDRLEHALDTFPESFLCLNPEEQQVSLALYRLLAEGAPASKEEIARAAGVSGHTVGELLSRWSGVYFDDEGRVIGYWGLALPEMSHRFEVEGQTVYTWCAWDALFIPELIQKPARVTSKSPVTGAEIHLTVSPERAERTDGPEVYVSFLEPCTEQLDQDVIGTFCHYVFFFASEEEGRQWTEAHPDTYLLTLEQAFALGKRKNALQYGDLLRAPRPRSHRDARARL